MCPALVYSISPVAGSRSSRKNVMNRSGPVRREIASDSRPVISATGTPSSAHAWNEAWSEAIRSAGPTPLPQTSAIVA